MKQTIIIGERYTALLKNKLNTFGLTVLPLPDNPDIAPNLAGHTDLSIFYPGEKEIFLAGYLKNTEFAGQLAQNGLCINYIREKQSPVYPADVPLNARLLTGGSVLLNRKTVSRDVLEYLEPSTQTKQKENTQNIEKRKIIGNYDDGKSIVKNDVTIIYDELQKDCRRINNGVIIAISKTTDDFSNRNHEIIGVNQGYAACATLDCRHGIISSDNGICEAARKHGINVLQISQGFISLPGYSYGFIGGSAFLLGNRMLFTGSLRNHPDRDRILSFLADGDIEPMYLTDEEIFDIGGAVLISFPP